MEFFCHIGAHNSVGHDWLRLVGKFSFYADMAYNVRHRSLAATGNSTHKAHVTAGVDQIRVLSDGTPCHFHGSCTGNIVIACRSGHTVKLQRLYDTKLIHILFHIVRTDQCRNLREGAVAGSCQRFLQIEFSMCSFTGYLINAILIKSCALEGLIQNAIHTVQSSRSGHHFEDGTGNIGGLHKAVQVDTFIGTGGIPFDIRNFIRIVGGSCNGAKDLAGFVVIHSHGSFPVSHCFQCSCLHFGRQCEHRGTCFPAIGIQAVNDVVPGHFLCIMRNSGRTDAAAAVTQPVQCRTAHRFILCVGT